MTSPASPASAVPPSLVDGTVIADKYRIDGVIGQGGMGVVLRATHVQLDRVVAIKVVKHDLAEKEEIVARMLIEARAAASIKSEHVARVLDVARLDDGTPYIVMEYLEGKDLWALLGERVQLGISETVDYVLQACEALAEAHAAGIVHRDLKPENLYLHQTRDGSNIVKVLDFGISKTTAAGPASRRGGQMALTSAHGVVGSVHYMAPEQMRASSAIDTRADIYALGSILFELLTGNPPFDAESVPEVCAMVLSDRPAPLTAVRADVPVTLDAVVQRCLEKDRENRYANVAELADDLAPFGTEQARRSAGRISRVLLGKPSRITGADGTGAFAAARSVARSELPTQTALPPLPGASSARRWWVVAAVAGVAAIAILYATLGRGTAPAPEPAPSAAAAPSARAAPAASAPSVTVAEVVSPQAPSAEPVDSAPPRHPLAHPAPPAKPKAKVDPFDTSAFGGRR